MLDDQPEAWSALAAAMHRPDADQLTGWASAAVIGRQGYEAARRPLRDAMAALTAEQADDTWEDGEIRGQALDALAAIGRHNRVRIFADGRIVPVQPGGIARDA